MREVFSSHQSSLLMDCIRFFLELMLTPKSRILAGNHGMVAVSLMCGK